MSEIATDRNGHIDDVYLGGMAALVFLTFVVALWTVLRAAEREAGPSVLALLGGFALTLTVLVANGVLLALV